MQKKQRNQKYFNGQRQHEKGIQQQLKEQVEKVQYFKLVFQLQEQKKLICEQKLQSLRQEIQQKRRLNEQLSHKLIRITKKYDKLKQKQKQRQDSFQSNRKDKILSQKNKIQSFEQDNTCMRCVQLQLLQAQLFEERELYASDRILFKNQISKLKQELQTAQQLIQDKQMTQNSLDRQINLTLKLKNQLTLCYQKIQNQINLIQIMNEKLTNFQFQYSNLLQLVKQLQWKYQEKNQNNLTKIYKNYEPNRDNQKIRNENLRFNHIQNDKYLKCISHKDKQNKRRCGSIKRMQIKQDTLPFSQKYLV